MLCRRLINNFGPNLLKRSLSSDANKLTVIDVDDKTGVAQLTLNRPPVNGLNLELLQEINQSIKQIEKNKCRGLILTSSSTSVFSAGLDLLEMYQPEKKRISDFWSALQDTWISLYGTSLPTAALINGHAPAGGCLLATSCEYRVMLPNFTIGLNETLLGIVAPPWFMATLLNVVPRRIAELALTQGKMFSTEEALQCGLIDDVVPTKELAEAKCLEFFDTFKKVNPMARAMTKRQLRQPDIQQLIENRQKDLEQFTSFAFSAPVQKGLGQYLEALKKKSSKAK